MHLNIIFFLVGLVGLSVSAFTLYTGMIGLEITATEVSIYAVIFVVSLMLFFIFGGKVIRNYFWSR